MTTTINLSTLVFNSNDFAQTGTDNVVSVTRTYRKNPSNGNLTTDIDNYLIAINAAGTYTIINSDSSVAVVNKIEFNLNVASIIITNSVFTRQVNVSLTPSSFSLTNCTLGCNRTEGDTTNLNITSASKTVNMSGNQFNYKGVPCFTSNNGSITHTTTSSIVVETGTNISIDNFTSPSTLMATSVVNGFLIKLTANSTIVFTPVTNERTFILLGSVTILNTKFTAQCTFNMDTYNLTFSGCTFETLDTSPANKYLAVTKSNSNTNYVNFDNTVTGGGYNHFYPRNVAQVQAGYIWDNQVTVVDGSNKQAILSSTQNKIRMYLHEADYTDLEDLTYFKSVILVPRSATLQYKFGSTGKRLTSDLHIELSTAIDTNINNNTDFHALIYTNGGSLFLRDTNGGDVTMNIDAGSIISASNGNPAIQMEDVTDGNMIIYADATVYNNNNILISNKFNLLTSNVTGYYQTATSCVNLGNENSYFHDNNNLYLSGTTLKLAIPPTITGSATSLNDKFIFHLTGAAAVNNATVLSGATIRAKFKIVLVVANMYIANSYIALDSTQTHMIDIQNTAYNIIFPNCVVNYPSGSTTTLVGNIRTGGGYIIDSTVYDISGSVNFTTLDYGNGYFHDNCIFNMIGDATLQNIPTKNLRLSASTDATVTITGGIFNNGDDNQLYIVGDILRATPTSGACYNIATTGSSAVIKFSGVTFTKKEFTSSGAPTTGTLITYNPLDNNEIAGTGTNIKLSFLNSKFYITKLCTTLAVDYDITNNYSAATLSGSDYTYKVYIQDTGEFLLHTDPLVNLADHIYFDNAGASATTVTLAGAISGSLYSRRLTTTLESSTAAKIFNWVVKSTGLNIVDNSTNTHTVTLETGTDIDISSINDTTANVINLTASTNNCAFVLDDVALKAGNHNSYIHMADATIAATANRTFTINTSGLTETQTASTKVKHFIFNEDTILLTLNDAIDTSYTTHNLVYWPKLVSMYDVGAGRVDTPLSGTAVKYVESWLYEKASSLTTYKYDITNNYTDTANAGLQCPDWTGTHEFRFLQIYSKAAIESGTGSTLDSLNMRLNKDYTNTTTNHTGKISNSDSVTDTHVNLKGWLNSLIDFTATEIVLMPSLNEVELIVDGRTAASVVITDSGKTILAYKITNPDLVTKGGENYTIKNYLNTTISDVAVLSASFDRSTKISKTTGITLSETIQLVNDGTGNLVEGSESKTISYIITPVSGSKIYLLIPITISFPTPPTNVGGISSNITYPNIDNVNITGDSNTYTISVNRDPNQWTTKTVNVNFDISAYTGVNLDNIQFSYTITNKGGENQLYGFALEAINSPISNFTVDSSSTVNFSTVTTAPTDDFITSGTPGNYVYTLERYIALYARIITGSGFTPTIKDSNKLYVTNGTSSSESDPDRGTVTFTRYNYNSGTSSWVVDPTGNTDITASDKIFRYKVTIQVSNTDGLLAATDYSLRFKVIDNNPTPIIQTPLTVNTSSLNIPLLIDISTTSPSVTSTGDITRNTDRDIYLIASALFAGRVSLSFTDRAGGINSSWFITNGLTQKVDGAYTTVGTLVSFNATKKVTLTYKYNSDYISGDFDMDVTIDQLLRPTGNDTSITITTLNNAILTYQEDRQNQLTMGVGRVINSGRENVDGLDVTTLSSNNKLSLTESGNDLIPTTFASSGAITGGYLTPINKYTQYFISVTTTQVAFTYSPPVYSALTVTLTFKDGNDNTVDDIEVFNCNPSSLVFSEDASPYSVTVNNKNSQNFVSPGTSGNNVLFFRRKIPTSASQERSYTTLQIYYTISGVAGTTYENIATTPTLLGTIDYSNVGTVSAKFSEICIGNWRLVPSGDGARLMFISSKYQDPLNVTVPTTEAAITAVDDASNVTTLRSINY